MIRTEDTSYYIINNKDKKELFIYYDTKHDLDCNMTLLHFQLVFDIDKNINNDNKDEILQKYFQDNCPRFFMIKSLPYEELLKVGIPFEQILNLANEIAKSKIRFEDYTSI